MISTLYEPFRHWSEGGSVYILSDLHFADSDCKLMDPDWIGPEEQLAIINGMVHKNDAFVCLGDVGDPKYVPMIKARKKILVLGNHDAKGAYKNLFDEIYTGPLFIADKILLSHEPVYGLPWCLNIHGHDHNGTEDYADGCKHMNLSANICGYVPVNLGKLIKDGILTDIASIHRMAIDRAAERKYRKVSDGVAGDARRNPADVGDAVMENELFKIRQGIKNLQARHRELMQNVPPSESWIKPEELRKYTGEQLNEIAVVISGSDTNEPHIEIWDAKEADLWIGVTEEGCLSLITMISREHDDYEEEVFDEPMGDGSYRAYDSGRCLYGYLWLRK